MRYLFTKNAPPPNSWTSDRLLKLSGVRVWKPFSPTLQLHTTYLPSSSGRISDQNTLSEKQNIQFKLRSLHISLTLYLLVPGRMVRLRTQKPSARVSLATLWVATTIWHCHTEWNWYLLTMRGGKQMQLANARTWLIAQWTPETRTGVPSRGEPLWWTPLPVLSQF